MKTAGLFMAGLFLAPFSVFSQNAEKNEAIPNPEVWIFNGTPGDDEHHKFYEDQLGRIRKSLTERYGIAKDKLHVYYGPVDAGYAGLSTRESMLEALKAVVEHSRSPDAAPVWLIFQGHANRIPGGVMFNLPGPDLSAREIGEALKEYREGAQLVVIATTACSDAFLKPLAGKGRIVLTANAPGDKDNETELPSAFVQTLEAPGSDTDEDGTLTVTELFLGCFARVIKIYESGGFLITEHPQLDGDGDGRATQRPAQNDAAGAAKAGLKIGGQREFD